MIVKLSWTGSTARPSRKQGKAQWRILRTFCENGGAEGSTYDDELPTGPHISFASTIQKLICGLQRGAKGHADEWVSTAHVVWSEVIGSCGFRDGSCDNGKCGASILIQTFTEALGWVPIYKKCGPVLGQSSLDAELGGCGLLMENVRPWIDKCVR